MIVGLSARMQRTPTGWRDEFEKACATLGLEARVVPVDSHGWMEAVKAVDVFVWRPKMGDPSEMAEIRTKIPLIEAMGIPCFPNSLMLWLYDDKIRETLFLKAHGHPVPETFISFNEKEARAYLEGAAYPLIAKTHMGASASGVVRLQDRAAAMRLLKGIFRPQSLVEKVLEKYHYLPRLAKGDFLLARKYRYLNACPSYIYAQEFIEADSDWRITTLGTDLLSVFVRRNRPDDFRASGSGLWEMVEPEDLPMEACDLALEISNRHGFTSMAYDFMKGPKGWVIGEISMTFVLNAVYTTTLFRRTPAGYAKQAPIPIGVMHLSALMEAQERGTAIPHWPMA
jgi:glutathione synthase/RimK-type ligase-like ATP-grasp enzyme